MRSLSRTTIGLICSVSILGVITTGLVAGVSIASWQKDRQQDSADRAYEAVDRLLGTPVFQYSLNDVRKRLDELVEIHGVTEVQIFSASGEMVYGPELFFNGGGHPRTFLYEFPQETGLLKARTVMVAVDTEEDHHLLEFMTGVFALAVLVWSVLSLFISMRLMQVVLRPIDRLTNRIHHLGDRSIDVVIDHQQTPVELHPFIDGFNALFARLRENRERLRSFNSNVAHELNTPLSSLKVSHELLTRKDKLVGEELQTVVLEHLDEIERMSRIVKSMLFLANAERGRFSGSRSWVDLLTVVQSVVDYLDPLLNEKQLKVVIHGRKRASVEVELIKRAMSNLLGNAIRHAREHSSIVVDLGPREGNLLWITVTNEGADIPPQSLPYLFDAFFRAENARSSRGENHGLGLAIVAAIARIHGGTTLARSQGGHTTIGFSVVVD
ncbi:MAG: ATP-binding protein [Limnobacter sp.]|uniref:ATP-binding protein n=1 Tax=Limnobacter sp. TaxID=2003368 RepID=UPI00391DCDB8